jgi:hypothetical protein
MKTITKKLHYFALAPLLFISSCVLPPDEEITDLDGTWSCSETSSVFGSTTYEVNISSDVNNPYQIYLENFYNLGFSNTASATISGDVISISTQTIDGYQISGSGTINSQNSLSFEYTAYDGADTDNISSTYTKK